MIEKNSFKRDDYWVLSNGIVVHFYFRNGDAFLYPTVKDFGEIQEKNYVNKFGILLNKRKELGYYFHIDRLHIPEFIKSKSLKEYLGFSQPNYTFHQGSDESIVVLNKKQNICEWYPNVEIFDICSAILRPEGISN